MTLKAGDKVTTSGYPGTVARRYSPGMVEVRLESGLVCVADEDCVLDRRERLILEAHGEHCGCSSCAWKKILDEVTR